MCHCFFFFFFLKEQPCPFTISSGIPAGEAVRKPSILSLQRVSPSILYYLYLTRFICTSVFTQIQHYLLNIKFLDIHPKCLNQSYSCYFSYYFRWQYIGKHFGNYAILFSIKKIYQNIQLHQILSLSFVSPETIFFNIQNLPSLRKLISLFTNS